MTLIMSRVSFGRRAICSWRCAVAFCERAVVFFTEVSFAALVVSFVVFIGLFVSCSWFQDFRAVHVTDGGSHGVIDFGSSGGRLMSQFLQNSDNLFAL